MTGKGKSSIQIALILSTVCCAAAVFAQPASFVRVRHEGGEVPCTVTFSIRRARKRTPRSVEHQMARECLRVGCIAFRSRSLVNGAG